MKDIKQAIKSMMDGDMNATDYARQEGWDITTASQALQMVASLISSEANEPGDLAKLKDIMARLTDFINGEITEIPMGAISEPKSITPDFLVAFGGEVKALPNGEIGGYLVRFSTANDPDLTGDFFTKDTDFGTASESMTWYHHRMPVKSKNGAMSPAYKQKIGVGKSSIKKDDIGVFVQASLDLRNEYEKAIYEMAQAGKLGWSSGTAPHLVDREPAGKSASFIKSWPLGLDASLTPAPAEGRNLAVVALKSLITPDAALPDKDDVKTIQPMENKKMSDEIKAAVDAALAEREVKAAAEVAKQAELKAANEAGYKAAVAELEAKGQIKKAPAYVKDLGSDSDDGASAFKSWLATGEVNKELIPPSMENGFSGAATKAAFNVTTGASGAFLVPDPLYQQIIAKRQLASWARQAPVQAFSTPADHILVPVEDTKATNFVLTSEAGSYNEDEPTVAQKDIILYKYTKLVKMSEEFVNYQGTNFDAWIANVFSRAEATTENTIFTKGSGSGEPQGVYTGATNGNTVTTSAVLVPGDLTALIGQLGAGYNVQGQTGFLMQNATNWYLRGTSSSNYFAFINTPAPGVATQYNEGFLGRPAYTSDDMDAYTVASSAGHSVIYGNWNFFGIAEKPGLLIQRNPYLYMGTGQIGLFATMFRGSAVLQGEAFYRTVGK